MMGLFHMDSHCTGKLSETLSWQSYVWQQRFKAYAAPVMFVTSYMYDYHTNFGNIPP